ncbi:hypothetical protein HN924_01925 [Candidatus Woesearchaeota archaeon]|jgi:hypothetical protein|nr:hypothetical protein [Candidatus Woesearchaeota archaeon]MBT7062706.1 hypothetical protein [Candidatus Woesearchaeota archaeon]MBT7402461.1 hypothetical protein [Candidatus Woesearchaeota archaeon]
MFGLDLKEDKIYGNHNIISRYIPERGNRKRYFPKAGEGLLEECPDCGGKDIIEVTRIVKDRNNAPDYRFFECSKGEIKTNKDELEKTLGCGHLFHTYDPEPEKPEIKESDRDIEDARRLSDSHFFMGVGDFPRKIKGNIQSLL